MKDIYNRLRTLGPCLIATIVALTGCATSEVPPTKSKVPETSNRPNRILVFDFAATIEDVSAEAPLAARLSARPSLSPEQVTMERQLGVEMSAQLIKAIREMGLPAERALPGAKPEINDVVIRGYLVSILQPTNAAKRFTVGLDPGAAEFTTAIENFQIAPQGYGRSLGFGPATAGEKVLGAAIGEETNPAGHIVASGMKNEGEANRRARIETWSREAVAEIASRLKTRFQEHRWIN